MEEVFTCTSTSSVEVMKFMEATVEVSKTTTTKSIKKTNSEHNGNRWTLLVKVKWQFRKPVEVSGSLQGNMKASASSTERTVLEAPFSWWELWSKTFPFSTNSEWKFPRTPMEVKNTSMEEIKRPWRWCFFHGIKITSMKVKLTSMEVFVCTSSMK